MEVSEEAKWVCRKQIQHHQCQPCCYRCLISVFCHRVPFWQVWWQANASGRTEAQCVQKLNACRSLARRHWSKKSEGAVALSAHLVLRSYCCRMHWGFEKKQHYMRSCSSGTDVSLSFLSPHCCCPRCPRITGRGVCFPRDTSLLPASRQLHGEELLLK